ncbi:DUF4422 domain-containing protein [Oribacterium sp. WCC10]|uniref:DUF4422 domain-containing protein n=1 Tax=Oribacterium sp. WCC10 TaxID=1855343 RepID=UPI0008E95088|nr:DUF4422 domain-containing protein [Oribacterium sp. WCC10]SFG25232.1 protein of unknown function [Oribacterium sp. WCC10]
MKIIVYGIDELYYQNKPLFAKSEIVALCDKEPDRQIEDRHTVIKPKELSRVDYDFIVVTSQIYFCEIASELFFYHHVEWNKIINLGYYRHLIDGEAVTKNWPKSLMKVADCPRTGEMLLHGPTGCFVCGTEDFDNPEREIINSEGVLVSVEKQAKSYVNYIVSHKPYRTLNSKDYQTIWVGSNPCPSKDFLRDNTGDNISEYNHLINECTAIYWIWKQAKEDIVGLSHYRRFLSSPMNPKGPVSHWEVCEILKRYDLIVADSFYFVKRSIYEQMRVTIDEEGFFSSVEALREAVNKFHPDDCKYLEQVLSGKMMFPCNLFIMPKKLLDEYCTWLFPILIYMIENVIIRENWDTYSKRVIGFWAERMLTVWILKSNYKVYELTALNLDEVQNDTAEEVSGISSKEKKAMLDLITTYKEMHDQLKACIRNGVIYEANDMLSVCQDAAVKIGTGIEKAVGEGSEAVQNLEAYCEQAYQLFQKINVGSSVDVATEITDLQSKIDEVETFIRDLTVTTN